MSVALWWVCRRYCYKEVIVRISRDSQLKIQLLNRSDHCFMMSHQIMPKWSGMVTFGSPILCYEATIALLCEMWSNGFICLRNLGNSHIPAIYITLQRSLHVWITRKLYNNDIRWFVPNSSYHELSVGWQNESKNDMKPIPLQFIVIFNRNSK